MYTYCLLVCYSVPLFGRGLHTLPLYPLPQGQERRPSATLGTGPTPCGAASLHSHMESRGFHSPQTGPLLSAPGAKQVLKKRQNLSLNNGACLGRNCYNYSENMKMKIICFYNHHYKITIILV